jgi:hypothetical protein
MTKHRSCRDRSFHLKHFVAAWHLRVQKLDTQRLLLRYTSSFVGLMHGFMRYVCVYPSSS